MSRAQFTSAFHVDSLSPREDGGVLSRAAFPLEARATGEAVLGGEAVLRRLAAIVACYSRFLEADEEGTLARLKSLRDDLIDAKITLHKGRTLRTASYGTLIEFADAFEATPIVAG
jgi:hypothetical protein